MREEQQILIENLFSGVKKEKTKKDDSSFLKMIDIYTNYPQFIKEKNILGAKTYVEHKRKNIISRYTGFLREEGGLLTLGSFVLMWLSIFYVIVIGATIYNDSVFEVSFMICGGGLASLWALVIKICKSYDKIDKEENEENNRKALTEENQKLIEEKIELNKKINYAYIKELLKSDNEYMDNLKNEYVDGLSHISIYQLEILEKKLQDDIKYINLSRVKK